jgi:hypothetical protein
MRCLVTGTETTNKWNNMPICKEAVDIAKDMRKEKPHMTLRNCLRDLQKEWRNGVTEELAEFQVAPQGDANAK